MPALISTIKKASGEGLKDRRVGVCLHVSKETSVLVIGLRSLGAEVSLCAANPLSTQDEIAAYLSTKGVHVYAWKGESASEYKESIRNVLRDEPDIVMDDGADAHAMIHQEDEFSNLRILGGTEETTTGVLRLKALEKSGILRYPVIAVNNAKTKHLFDNRYGTGQSTFDGIMRSTALLIAGKQVVVCGYGWVGRGIAARARGLGAHVIVTEIDPVKALEAHTDGFEAMPMREASLRGDFFITATGQTGVIRGEHIDKMKNGAILANAGHFDVEVDVKYLEAQSTAKKQVRPYLDEYSLPSGRVIYLLAQGRIANLVAAEGHPPEVMMMSFSNQLLSALHISKQYKVLGRRIHEVPAEIDSQVANNALEAIGVIVDNPTPEQVRYGESWN